MFKRFDLWLENKLKKNLDKKRDKIINKTVEHFKKIHPDLNSADFIKLANSEADRIYAFIDKSILRERIQRAKVTFWITAIIGIILALIINGLSLGAALPATLAIIPAFVAWAGNIITIPISYNQRIKGGMDSVLNNYEKILSQPKALSFAQIMVMIEISKKNIPNESIPEALTKGLNIDLSPPEKQQLLSLFFTHQPLEHEQAASQQKVLTKSCELS